jgi:DNA topoisomerase-1
MPKNLVIVESPAKAKTIARYLGSDFSVKSSYGHIRDLPKKDMGIDLEKNFEPTYTVAPDKKKVVAELRAAAKGSEVWLASDEDREGEAIAWHVAHLLKLDPAKVKRIVFHEITESAITEAVKNPRAIDQKLVDAQQARRVLDRLVGYELSPVLWRKVRPGLSAGRVQSVAVRLIVEREREIRAFKPVSSFKVTAVLLAGSDVINAELAEKLAVAEDVEKLLNAYPTATFKVGDVDKKPGKRTPSPPFITSTLQQTASSRLGFSVRQTMSLAQRLYENGHITYMRTDSPTLSTLALGAAKTHIIKNYGDKYYESRQFRSKSRGAQEAHEGIGRRKLWVESAGYY